MDNNELLIFNNDEFGNVHTIIIDGKPFFMATDIAKSLGYKRPADAITTHCKGSVKHRVLTDGGQQECKFIPESDVYRLIIKSKLPSAIKFENWVMNEVLPQIRQTGTYSIAPQPNLSMAEMTLIVIQDLQQQVENAKKEITVMQPKANFYDSMNRDTETKYTATSIAKLFGMTAQSFNKMLKDEKVQYKSDGHWVLYHDWDNKGLVVYVPVPYTKKDGSTGTKLNMMFTSHGLVWIVNSLAKRNIIPNDMSQIPNITIDMKTF